MTFLLLFKDVAMSTPVNKGLNQICTNKSTPLTEQHEDTLLLQNKINIHIFSMLNLFLLTSMDKLW